MPRTTTANELAPEQQDWTLDQANIGSILEEDPRPRMQETLDRASAFFDGKISAKHMVTLGEAGKVKVRIFVGAPKVRAPALSFVDKGLGELYFLADRKDYRRVDRNLSLIKRYDLTDGGWGWADNLFLGGRISPSLVNEDGSNEREGMITFIDLASYFGYAENAAFPDGYERFGLLGLYAIRRYDEASGMFIKELSTPTSWRAEPVGSGNGEFPLQDTDTNGDAEDGIRNLDRYIGSIVYSPNRISDPVTSYESVKDDEMRPKEWDLQWFKNARNSRENRYRGVVDLLLRAADNGSSKSNGNDLWTVRGGEYQQVPIGDMYDLTAPPVELPDIRQAITDMIETSGGTVTSQQVSSFPTIGLGVFHPGVKSLFEELPSPILTQKSS
ncbi:MAG: hypothetical protein HYV40_01845 [Candidatus Levybacteria bacterium]|nr:hypothetical protein [Candidatus Levybacteria bacterium]